MVSFGPGRRPSATRPRFQLGELVVTKNALRNISVVDMLAAINRHRTGDWGDVCAVDKESNDESLREGGRLFSSYQAGDGTRFWVITEADRSVTTILLPEDY